MSASWSCSWRKPVVLAGALLLTAASMSSALGQSKPGPSKSTEANSAPVQAGEWPQFLGPRRNGISAETGLLERWPEAGPKPVWRAPGGVGMSGLAISRGQLVALVQREGKQSAIALNAVTGEPVWEQAIAPAFQNGRGNGPRATPAISGDQVFAFTGEGILAALAFTDGKVRWSHNVLEDLKGEMAEYGMACSPLVVGDQVLVIAGAPKATVAAFDTKSGKRMWTAGNDTTGYSSPALLDVGGRCQIVVSTGSSVLGLAPNKGTVLWRFPYVTDFDCNIATPLAVNEHVFVSSGENHGSVLLALKPRGEQFDVTEVWKSQGPKSVLRNEWQTSVLIDGYLYGMDNVGGAGPITHLTCVNATTGERAWQQLRFGKGNLIAADGKLFISTIKGELVVVQASPKSYEEVGRAEVCGPTRQAPALANKLLYLRDDQEIICLDVQR